MELDSRGHYLNRMTNHIEDCDIESVFSAIEVIYDYCHFLVSATEFLSSELSFLSDVAFSWVTEEEGIWLDVGI